MRRKRLKKISEREARLTHVAMGRHHAVTRKDDPIKVIEDRMRRTRDTAPIIDAIGIVVGILVALIWR